jgi:hypothetical protein
MGLNKNNPINELLSQATCSVAINDTLVGTAWLVNNEKGILITAGHVLGKRDPANKVKVQFSGDRPRNAHKINWGYQSEMGIDFAVLQLNYPDISRTPIPVTLKTELEGDFIARGYGVTLVDQSGGQGYFLGPLDPQNCASYRIFMGQSKELGEKGYSGAAIFSNQLNAVVAIQTEATIKDVGSGRDTILTMPLYRIAKFYDDLYDSTKNKQHYRAYDIPFEKKSKIKTIFDVDVDDLKVSPCRLHSTYLPCQVDSLCLISELLRNETTMNETVRFIVQYAELWNIAYRLESLLRNSYKFAEIRSEYERLGRQMQLVYGFFSELDRPYSGDDCWKEKPHRRLEEFIKLRIKSLSKTKIRSFIESFEIIFKTLIDLGHSNETESRIIKRLKSQAFFNALNFLIENYESFKDQLDILAYKRLTKTRDCIINALSDTKHDYFHDRLQDCLVNLPHNNDELPHIWKAV